MNDDMYLALVAYGLYLLGQATSQQKAAKGLAAGLPGPPDKWEAYEECLGDERPPEKALSSIFSWVALPDQEEQQTLPQTAYYAARPLVLERETLFPLHVRDEDDEERLATLDEAWKASDLSGLWEGFAGEYEKLWERFRQEGEIFLETFYHLMYRYAWALPCTYGEEGVSLFEQWKAVAALAVATGEKWADGPSEKFILIGGDIPGIQDFVYTITSKGAAKGLRGRSFFVQLLGDAVVRRLLTDLKLCPANVVYNAGGNFMVLGPRVDAEMDGKTAKERLEGMQKEMDGALLDVFEGDLALCLAYELLGKEQINTAKFAAPVSFNLKQGIARQKRRRFREIACDCWENVFGPQGSGGVRFCVVCHRDLDKGQGVRIEDEWWCEYCHSFGKLAQAIARDELLLFVGKTAPAEPAAWQRSLYKVSGLWYAFGDKLADMPGGANIYTVNRTDFLTRKAQGFRFLANTTPRILKEDIEWFKDKYPDEEAPKREEVIKDFDLMGRQAVGLKQVGVLRMDVDNLGRIITRYLEPRTMTRTSALSATLDRFFAGYMGCICEEVMAKPKLSGLPVGRSNLLYTIYAGGDDLFIVGSWDLMPQLARRIHDDFTAYVGHNPHVHISAGITLEGRKFPLYRAAAQAGEALDNEAKEYKRKVNGQEREKDAICFLGQVVGWEDWELVRDRADLLAQLIKREDVPRGLLQTLQMIYHRFLEDQKEARRRGLSGEQVYYGPWMWRKAYQLSRIRQRYEQRGNKEVVKALKSLELEVMAKEQMPYVGLATRWAEYLTRGQEG